MNRMNWKLLVSAALTLVPGVLVTLMSNIMSMADAPLWMEQMGSGFFYMIIGVTAALAVIDVIALVITEKTNSDRNRKIKDIVYWLLPIISFVSCYFLSAYLFGFAGNNERLMVILFALLFIVIGNYLPKCQKNTTIGIKVKWALQNNRNWEATHRFCGRLWVVGGFLMAIGAFLPGNIGVYGFIVITLILAFVPVLYSYLFYRKQLKNGSYSKDAKSPKTSRIMRVISVVAVAAIIIAVCVLLFGGHIEYKFRNHYVTVDASFYADMNLNYQDIADIQFVEHKVHGSRVFGLGTARLSCGAFKNDELGDYTSYRYVGTKNAIVITTKKGETIVFSARNEEETKALYDELLTRI